MFVAISSLLLLAAAEAPAPAAAAAADVVQILRDSDRLRGGLKDGITWTIDVESTEDGVTTRQSFLVKSRGDDALAETLAPPRSKGEKMLFNDRTLWFLKPGLKKPVSISARQKLSGQAANGDIASTNYARDYDATLSGEESIDGALCWRLELKAKAKNVTYDRIRYWVAKDQRRALKAEFLTVSGEVFKAATFEYGNVVTLAGAPVDFIKSMTIKDAMGSGAVSVLRFGPPKSDAHAPSLFNVNNVVR